MLETVPVCDVELERALTGIRAILLDAAGEGPATPSEDGLLRFCCALARQCFINEYVFDVTPEELDRVERMRERLVRAMASGAAVPVLWMIAVGSYLPLHSLPGADALLAQILVASRRRPADAAGTRAPGRAAGTRFHSASDRHRRSMCRSRSSSSTRTTRYPRWVKPAPAGEPKTLPQYFGRLVQTAPGARPARQDRHARCGLRDRAEPGGDGARLQRRHRCSRWISAWPASATPSGRRWPWA